MPILNAIIGFEPLWINKFFIYLSVVFVDFIIDPFKNLSF